ncbi:methyl-accepting chemotaxis protein [Paucibacter sp. R3-3]|uniref:Methyl-accepting chemotaxis protein n=1 Tax=Roseateles agri TaxID=3098619 RepID=A0ABU5DH67_9BURK|nr:methyl-accepting chemotaxis protein [Paucibacter sp. R3-3]MDY0745622.1 methyl-accepting chemotaxis protein [Paucibacter sp. R3-3]
MSFLSNLRVGPRLGLGFGALLLLVLGMGLFAADRVDQVQGSVSALSQRWLPGTQQLAAMNEALNQMRRAELQLMLGGGEKAYADESARIARQWELMPGLQKDYEATLVDSALEQKASELKAAIESYRTTQPRLLALVHEGKAEDALAYLRGDSRKAFRSTTDAMAALKDLNDQGVARADADASASYRSVLWGIWLTAGIAVALGGVIAALLTRSMTVPLGLAAAAAHRIAGGDLSARVQTSRGDELGDLLRALGRMQEALNLSVGTVKLSADSIASASAEVSSGGHDLSTRTEQAASSLQQTSAAMQQVTDTVRQSADAARQAHTLADAASGVAVRGGEVVARVVTTMEGIQATSRRIGDIIGVIDGIAFQTNILALNAAVEAARAGEQGRGFAVVASEVRTLAQRSAQAAREIKALISRSVEEVDGGVHLVADAGATMEEVVGAVRRVGGLIGEMSRAIQQQTQSLGEVNTAIGHLDGMTQQNAALVEESAAASESLRDQAARLTEVVGRFRLQGA